MDPIVPCASEALPPGFRVRCLSWSASEGSGSPLPSHPVPPGVREREAAISIEGLVAEPRRVTAADLAGMARHALRADFACEEGWTAADVGWRGIRLADVLALAGPLPEGAYVRVASGEYAVPLAMAEADEALLCDAGDSGSLSLEEGGPWRLLVPGGRCYTSVKWVDRLEVVAEPGEPTGERIARARL